VVVAIHVSVPGQYFLRCIRFVPTFVVLFVVLFSNPQFLVVSSRAFGAAFFSTYIFSANAFLEMFVFAWPSCLVFVFVCSPLQFLSRGDA